MPDQHVLRITDECGNAADVGAGGEGDQIRQDWKFTGPNDRDNKRRQHQTDRIDDEQRRQSSRREG